MKSIVRYTLQNTMPLIFQTGDIGDLLLTTPSVIMIHSFTTITKLPSKINWRFVEMYMYLYHIKNDCPSSPEIR